MKAILLFSALIYVAVMHYNLRQNTEKHTKIQVSASWSPTAKHKESHPGLVEKRKWSLNHTDIERIAWNANVDNAGNLLLDFETTELLEQIIRHMPGDIAPLELQRVSFLIKKSLPGVQGKQLALLIHNYYFFNHEYNASLQAIDNAQGDHKITLLGASKQDNEQRQEHYFGNEAAATLFARKNLNTNYFNQRRLVTMDKNLSPDEHKARLSALQERYSLALKKHLSLPSKK